MDWEELISDLKAIKEDYNLSDKDIREAIIDGISSRLQIKSLAKKLLKEE